MFKIFKINKRGESIIEVIIAAVVLILTSSAAAVLLSSAFESNALTRDRMRAINLAREGLEAVRNIRDTNILRSGTFKNSCWNFREEINGNNTCNDLVVQSTPSRLIQPGKKQLVLSDYYKWYLVDKSSVASNFDQVFKVLPLNSSQNIADPTDFYRTIEISYFEIDSNGKTDKSSDHVAGTLMEVKSSVFWRYQGKENRVILKTILSRYN